MMVRVLSIGILLSVCACGTFGAFTEKDVVMLSRAGVGDEVIIRRIEAASGGFDLSSWDLIELKGAGVSDRVLEAMVRSKREYPLYAPVFRPQIRDAQQLDPWTYAYGYRPYPTRTTSTLTKRQIMALAKAGVGEEAILEQIEVTGAVFDLSADDLIELKQAGVSERVMKAMMHGGEELTVQYVPVRSPFPSYFYPPYSAMRGPYGYRALRPSYRHPPMYRPPVEQPEGEGR